MTRCPCTRAGLPLGARQCVMCDFDEANAEHSTGDTVLVTAACAFRALETARPPMMLDAPAPSPATVPAPPPCQVTAAVELLARIARDQWAFAALPGHVQAEALARRGRPDVAGAVDRLLAGATDDDLMALGAGVARVIALRPTVARLAIWRGINARAVQDTEARLAAGPDAAAAGGAAPAPKRTAPQAAPSSGSTSTGTGGA